jgi:hypothetical protein
VRRHLRGYGLLAEESLRENRPKMYAELERSGELLPLLLEIQERVGNQVADLLHKGFQVHEAEELVRDQYLFPSEDEGEF